MKTLYYRFIYRRLMKLAHRFDWHHMRTMGPFEDGSWIVRCDWCGVTHRTPPIDYALRAGTPKRTADNEGEQRK